MAAAFVVAALALLLVVSSASAETTTLDSGGPLQATIKRDEHGIPNIIGQNFADVGFGYGYAFAQDNICTIADSYVTVNAQRSRYLGPDGNYVFRGNGAAVNNLNSDFFFQRINDNHVVENLLNQPPPDGPVEQIKQGVAGYVAGYNKYLEETGVDNLPDPRCRGAAWVRPITELDVYRRFYQLALLASGGAAINEIAAAQPPAGSSAPAPAAPSAVADGLSQKLPIDGIGSNAYGLGSQATANGKGMVLANPHFPWDGSERFYQAHLIIPGQVNVSGASLFGVPLVLIGHTDNLAWSHTVSTAYRFTPFEETLVPGSPTTYLYDGQPRQMSTEEVKVMAKTDSGLEERTRTLYSTVHGPVFTSVLGLRVGGQEPFPWTLATAFAMGDANAGNFRYLNHFFFTNQAQSVDEYDEIERKYQGIPWVNSIAADSSGKAYYADIGAIPNVSNAKAAACDTPLGDATFAALRLPVLNGATSACAWDDDPDAAAPGIFGPSHLPSLKLDSYVTNSNDSYWLSNPDHPLTGFARIIGDENTPRSLRTRLGLRIVQQRLDGSDGLPGTGFTRQQLQDAVFNNRQYAGELWRDQLVQMCDNAPNGELPSANTSQPHSVDVRAACDVLRNWNRHDDLDSNGAILFRRFASRALVSLGGVTSDPSIYLAPFNPLDPVNTPNGLNVANPKVQNALADAVEDLNKAGIPVDAPLRGYQYEKRGSDQIPIHGGPGTLGVFNAINVSWNSNPANPGYPDVAHGSSFVMVTSFTGGCPENRSILTYSQSENPNSPYFADQTRMFSKKEWVDPPFCPSELSNNPDLTTTQISTPAVGAAGAKAKAKRCKSKRHRSKHRRCKKK